MEILTNVRHVAVCPSPAWSRPLVRYHTPLRSVGESIGDEERVTSNLFNFVLGQIVSVPLSSYVIHQLNLDLLIEEQCVSMSP